MHNQRIERLWVDVYVAVTQIYAGIFQRLEHLGHFNIENEIHMYCLHYEFLPHLNEFVTAWYAHTISTEGNKSPNQL